MTRVATALLFLPVAAFADCRLKLQVNSAFAWNAWDQQARLKTLGYELAGMQSAREFPLTAEGERVAQQNVWLMRDERTGKVLCTAQVRIYRKEGRMKPQASAIGVADDLAEREESPACESAFDKVFAKLSPCPK